MGRDLDNMNTRHHTLLIVACLGALALAGCDKTPQATSKPAATDKAAAQPAAPAAPSAQPADQPTTGDNDEHYELHSPDHPVPVGQKAKVELSVTAADGLHVNQDFPWSFDFDQPQGVQLAQTKVAKGQIQFSHSVAKIPMYVEASTPGKHSLEATANFSVCDPSQCYVIRNQRVAFTIEATQPKSTSDGTQTK